MNTLYNNFKCFPISNGQISDTHCMWLYFDEPGPCCHNRWKYFLVWDLDELCPSNEYKKLRKEFDEKCPRQTSGILGVYCSTLPGWWTRLTTPSSRTWIWFAGMGLSSGTSCSWPPTHPFFVSLLILVSDWNSSLQALGNPEKFGANI